MKRAGWSLFALIVGSSGVHGASFDCAKASTDVERTICADAKLSKLDDELAAAYGVARKGARNPALLQRDQQRWLADRDRLCMIKPSRHTAFLVPDVTVLEKLYMDRIERLRRDTTNAPSGSEIGRRDYFLRTYIDSDLLEEIQADAPEICRLWGENLDRYAGNRTALACGRPLAPELQGLVRPEWTKLDPRANINLVRRLDRAIAYDFPPPRGRPFVETEWRNGFEVRLATGSIILDRVRLAFDGEQGETIIRYGTAACNSGTGVPAAHEGIKHYLVFDEAQNLFGQFEGIPPDADLVVHGGRVYAETLSGEGSLARVYRYYPGRSAADEGACDPQLAPGRCGPIRLRPRYFLPVCRYVLREAINIGGDGSARLRQE